MKKNGFIGTIVLVIVAVILLKVWFGFDIFKWLNQPEVKNFLLRIWSVLTELWDQYLAPAIRDFFRSFNDFIKGF